MQVLNINEDIRTLGLTELGTLTVPVPSLDKGGERR